MFAKLQEIKNHVHQHRAKYTAMVTIPATAIVVSSHYASYVQAAHLLSRFIVENNLGAEFVQRYGTKAL
jgi:hypothetical protein